MAEVKIRSPSQQKLCNELNKIVNEYTQIFQTLSSFDSSKEIMKCATSLASEEKMIENTVTYSHMIHENLKSLNEILDKNLQTIRPRTRPVDQANDETPMETTSQDPSSSVQISTPTNSSGASSSSSISSSSGDQEPNTSQSIGDEKQAPDTDQIRNSSETQQTPDQKANGSSTDSTSEDHADS